MITPYLSFGGRCREAFALYAEAFGGRIAFLETYGDAPGDPNTTPENKDLIRHAMVELGDGGRLMGADAMWPVQAGSAVSILVELHSLERARSAFETLSEGGAVLAPLAPFEDMGLMGSLSDRFGFSWQFVVYPDGEA